MGRMKALLLISLFSISGCVETMYCDQYHLFNIPTRCSPVAIALRADRLTKLHEEIHAQKLENLFLPSYAAYPFHRIPLASINTLLDLMFQPQSSGRNLAIAHRAEIAKASISPFSL